MREHKSQPISQDFGHYFVDTPYERDGSIVIKRLGAIGFGDEGYEGCITSFGESAINEEFIKEYDKIRF